MSEKLRSFKCWFCGNKSRRKTVFKTYCMVRKNADKAAPVRSKAFLINTCGKCQRLFMKGDKELSCMWRQTAKAVFLKKQLEDKLKRAIETERYEEAAHLQEQLLKKHGRRKQ